MKNVAYVGRDDLRVLDGHDLNKADVSGFHKTEFRRDEPVEVKNEVAEALTGRSDLFGNFIVVEREAQEDEEKAAVDKPATKKADRAATESSQETVGPTGDVTSR